MKRLVFLLAVLAGVIIAVWTTAAVVLDPQRFKAEFAKALERTFEHPVDVGHLEVRWDSLSHLTLEVREIVVYSDAERKALPFLRANRVEANLSLWRLFKKEIRLNKVFIESPFVRVIAVEPGRVLVAGAVMPAKKPAAAGGVGKAVPGRRGGFRLAVDRIEVKGARIRLQDYTKTETDFIELENTDIRIDRFSLTRPFTVEAAAALMSKQDQNLRIKASVRLASAKEAGLLEYCRIQTDLARLDTEALKKIWPGLSDLAFEAPFTGTIEALAEGLPLAGDWRQRFKVRVTLREVSAMLSAFKISADKIRGTITLDKDALIIEDLSGNLAGGSFAISASVNGYRSPEGTLKLKTDLTDIDLTLLTQRSARPGQTSLAGRLTLIAEATAAGAFTRESVARSLNGRARLILKDGMILNYNLFKDISGFMALIPKPSLPAASTVPETLKKRSEGRNTPLLPMDLKAEIRDGAFHFESYEIATDLLTIRGKGWIGLDGNVTGDGLLRFDSVLSSAFVIIAAQLTPLLNRSGQIEFPVKLKGHLPQFKILPDSRFVFTRVVVEPAQAAVNTLMKDPKGSLGVLGGFFEKQAS